MKVYDQDGIQLHQGDCLEVMRTLEPESVDAVVTDPPYFLTNGTGSGFMGKTWDSLSVENVVAAAFFKWMRLELNTVEESTAAQNVSVNPSKQEPLKEPLSIHAQSAEKKSEDQSHYRSQNSHSVQELVITKEEALVLCSELWPNLMTAVDALPNHAHFVGNFSRMQGLRSRSIVQIVADTLCEKPEWQESVMCFISTEEIERNVTVEMNGHTSENKYTNEMGTVVENAGNIVEQKKSNATTFNRSELLRIIRKITSSRCACPVMRSFTENQNSIQIISEVWHRRWAVEALRVLKPGGHLVAFGGARTYHRLVCGIEDAGFEIRDQLAWVYGSGFPKSLDVSKAIDKTDATEEQDDRRLRFTVWMISHCKIGTKEANRLMGTKSEASHYFTQGDQPHIATRDHFEKLRPYFNEDPPAWVEEAVSIRTLESKNFVARKVIGVQKNAMSGWDMDGGTQFIDRNITLPTTPSAKRWSGWGTALKPSWESIVLARKPLIGTVAANVLAHGTGGINVDGCRVDGIPPSVPQPKFNSPTGKIYGFKSGEGRNGKMSYATGRWPANLVHDGSPEVVGMFPDSKGQQGDVSGSETSHTGGEGTNCYGEYGRIPSPKRGDSGSAARFFYSAKVSADERGEGNSHPTVKPVALMRWLCRLITPPGGVVLDPFMGSGSTGKAAKFEGFEFIGIEMNPDYCEIAKKRLKSTMPLFDSGGII